MQPSDTEHLFSSLSERDPKQLKQVIEILINKSKLLVQTLEETCERLDQTQQERNYWKDSYFHLRDACSKYVDANSLTPFDYITALENELRKEKVSKSCLKEKFKVMQPRMLNSTIKTSERGKQQGTAYSDKFREQATSHKESMYRSHSSSMMKEEVRFQNKHKIGPKSIEFFRFKEHKA